MRTTMWTAEHHGSESELNKFELDANCVAEHKRKYIPDCTDRPRELAVECALTLECAEEAPERVDKLIPLRAINGEGSGESGLSP